MNAAAAVQKQFQTTVIPEIGEAWPEEGGIRVGYMPPQDGKPGYSLIFITDPAAQAVDLEWGRYGHKYPESSSWDGLANTKALVAAGDHPAAKHCDDLRITLPDGRVIDDCYLPARREASLMAATIPHLLPSDDACWTSTQYGANHAYVQDFASGYQLGLSKDNAYRVVAVRRVIH
jgi:hypothetical protein